MIKQKKKICADCGKETYIFSKGKCRSCQPKKSIRKISEVGKVKKAEKTENTKKLHKWFIDEIWNKRPHKSEISGKWLGDEPNSCFFHHIFPKSTYPKLAFNTENIIVLTADEHQEVETNPTKFEKINKIREELKVKYDK